MKLVSLERELFSLPARFAGLGLPNPARLCETQVANSEELTSPLLTLILAQAEDFDPRELAKTQKVIHDQQQSKLAATRS